MWDPCGVMQLDHPMMCNPSLLHPIFQGVVIREMLTAAFQRGQTAYSFPLSLQITMPLDNTMRIRTQKLALPKFRALTSADSCFCTGQLPAVYVILLRFEGSRIVCRLENACGHHKAAQSV